MRPALRLAALLLPLAAAAAPAPAAPGVAGIWKLEMKNLVASGEMYTTLAPDGACEQVARVKLVGTTHWAADRCRWTLSGSTLSMTVLESTKPPEKGKETGTVTVDAVGATEMKVSKDGKSQVWQRVTELPPEFQAQRLAQGAAPKP